MLQVLRTRGSRNFLFLCLILFSSSESIMEISPLIVDIPMVHAFCNSFSLSYLVGSCTVSFSLLIGLNWVSSSIGMSLFSRLRFFSSDTLFCAHRATLYLMTGSSSLSVFNGPHTFLHRKFLWKFLGLCTL